MAATTLDDLQTIITANLAGLSPQLRRAARFVVENPGDIAMRSQRYAAQVSQLPAPTFTRLARAVGLDDYDGLRDLCRADVLRSRTVLADRARALVADCDHDALPLPTRHANAAIRNVQAMVSRTDPQEFTNAARLLSRAGRVVLIGEMSARGLVDYASYVANMSLTGWKVLVRAGESLSVDLAMLRPDDACIIVSINPYANRAVEIAKHVVNCDVRLIAVTDNAMSPLAPMATHSFFVGTDSPQFFPSHVSSLMVIETLIDMVIRVRGAEAQKHIAAVERQNHQVNEYWQDGPAG